MGQKQLNNKGNDVVNMILENICVRNEAATPYLIAAMKTRSISSLNSISRSLFGSDVEHEKSVLRCICDNIRVVDSVSLLPKRNIIFTDDEKEHVL